MRRAMGGVSQAVSKTAEPEVNLRLADPSRYCARTEIPEPRGVAALRGSEIEPGTSGQRRT